MGLKESLDVGIYNVRFCYCIVCIWRKTFSVPKAEVTDFFPSGLHCDFDIMSNIFLEAQPDVRLQAKTQLSSFYKCAGLSDLSHGVEVLSLALRISR